MNENIQNYTWTNKKKIGFEEADSLSDLFFSKRFKNEYELFFRNEKTKRVTKISNTQQYSPRICWEGVVTNFNYLRTSSDKIISYFIEDCGDLAHAVMHIANIDGTFQVLIDNNYLVDYGNYNILRCNGGVLNLMYNENKEKSELTAYVGKNNLKYILAEDVSCFELLY